MGAAGLIPSDLGDHSGSTQGLHVEAECLYMSQDPPR
jgi:hypothetical protein